MVIIYNKKNFIINKKNSIKNKKMEIEKDLEIPLTDSKLIVRDLESYPENLRFVLDQITINETPKVVGSSSYITHKYPSDVDVFDNLTVSLSREKAAKFYAKQIQYIAQKIKIDNKLYLLDFKAGIDTRFDLDLNLDIKQKEIFIDKIYLEKLISKNEHQELFKVIENNEKLKELIKNLKTVRWTLDEMITGKKILRSRNHLTLVNAVTQNSVIKLDVLSWILYRFQSAEVFFYFKYIEDGRTYAFHDLGNYVESLLKDIEKYSSPNNYSPLRLSKRLWNLSLVRNCNNMLQALNPLLSSDAAALNQIKSDCETIMYLMAQPELRIKDFDRIFIELISFGKRIANHSKNYEKYLEIVDKFFTMYQHRQYKNIKLFIDLINLLIENLTKEITELSTEYLQMLTSFNLTCDRVVFV